MWIYDATPLIYLAKAERLSLLEKLNGPHLIPRRVYSAVVETGLEAGYPDARRIERVVDEEIFKIVSASETDFYRRIAENNSLSQADVSVLACANKRDSVAIVDETYGRDVASTEGVETRGTAYLVLLLAKRDVIESESARESIDSMMDAGWYCAPAVYAKISRKLDSLPD